MSHSKGNWSVGKHDWCVVTSSEIENKNGTSESEREYYGGHLICESVATKEDAKLIAAAPELLSATSEAVKFMSWLCHEISSGRIRMWSDKSQAAYGLLSTLGKAENKAIK